MSAMLISKALRMARVDHTDLPATHTLINDRNVP